MIKRLVRLSFQEDKIEDFIEIFRERKKNIKESPGCTHLELLQDKNNKNVFFTLSYWDSEVDLENYRQSDFFKATWKKTKILFNDKPMVWSTEVIA